MQTGVYKTTDPNKRIRVVQDEEYPTENPAFPYDGGVLEELQKCYEEGDYYGVIVEERVIHVNVDECTKEEWDIYRWEEAYSIWSCAGYENVAEEVAREYFGITVTGRG